MNSCPDLSIIIPAFQEQQTIKASISRLQAVLESNRISHEIILVSDGSTDDTVNEAKKLTSPNIRILHYRENRGKGYAIQFGFLHSRGTTIAFFDADLDLHPRSLIQAFMLLKNSDCDVVIGSKVHPNSQVNYPLTRRIQSRVYRLVTKLLFGLGVTDTQTGCKVFNRIALEDSLKNVSTSGFAFDLELLVSLKDNGLKICESPIDLNYHFSSSMPVHAALPILKDTLNIAYRRQRERKTTKAGNRTDLHRGDEK